MITLKKVFICYAQSVDLRNRSAQTLFVVQSIDWSLLNGCLHGKHPIMLPNMKYIFSEISLFPHHHQYLQKYMETNYYIKILIDLACINYLISS